MEQDRQPRGGGDHVHIAAKVNAEGRQQTGPTTAGQGLRSGVKHRRPRNEGEDRRRGNESKQDIDRWQFSAPNQPDVA